VAVLPTGTVTFLFTDIEGSTRRWESDPEGMRVALSSHDELLRTTIEQSGGQLVKHTGDGFLAVFTSAQSAVEAAISAQRRVALPVRMGLVAGEAELRDGDYFGTAVNRCARVMSAAHGGQILVSATVAAMISGVELEDLGMHRLRDVPELVALHQVKAEGLPANFPPLATAAATQGNLAAQLTSFVGRDAEVKELTESVMGHRLVTLTGVGGVGKTRLALKVAGGLVAEFPDGVWVIELAPVRDEAAVRAAVAGTLGITPRPNMAMVDIIAQGIGVRRMLIVLDNCEHVLDAAAELVEQLLLHCPGLAIIATSREGLRLGAEQVWPVPALGVEDGADSEAVELFVERARAVVPAFELRDDGDVETVTAICRGLDGLALAIELAAARMVSMSPQEVYDRLGDRFRLLSTAQRRPAHHQTLRHTVTWSYDLLDDDARHLLNRCSVFADGFDAAAAARLCGAESWDEFQVLDLLDSLVRKSLLTTTRVAGTTRFGCLETIRQFAEEQLVHSGNLETTRREHAAYFAEQAMRKWDLWNSPEQRSAIDWVDTELANLRAGFRWAAAGGDLALAVTIAAHTAMLSFILLRFEPVGWAEELVAATTDADLPQLPRLLTAASICALTGRPDVAIDRTQQALQLEADPRYDAFEAGWSHFWQMVGYRYAGPLDRWLEICALLADREGLQGVVGLTGLLAVLPGIGRFEEARAIAERGLRAAQELGVPFWIAFAAGGFGRAHTDVDPATALQAMQYSLDFAREHRNVYQEKTMVRDIAGLEAVLGDPALALELFDSSVAFFHRAGNRGSATTTVADVAVVLDRIGRFEAAATVYGTSIPLGTSMVPELPRVLDHLRSTLGQEQFDRCVASGSSMKFNDAMTYVREQIAIARRELTAQ